MIRLALHGGAGDPGPDGGDHEPHGAALRRIAERGRDRLAAGDDAVDVVEHVVAQLEDCPLFNAGVGAALNADGIPELDAAIMDGSTRAFGAVTGVSRIRNPVRLARTMMDRGPHILMFGAGAERYGREMGLDRVDPAYFIIPWRVQQLRQAQARGAIVLDHDPAFGTVGAVARDTRGRLAAATSTGGLTNKRPGRIGDSPVPGAGTYADDRSLAVSCTGTGESFLRACYGQQVHSRMVYGGESLLVACEAALADVKSCGGRGGCIAISRAGEVALPFNTHLMYRAWTDTSGELRVAVGANDAV